MKYPMINNWLTFKRYNGPQISVKDHVYEQEFIMDEEIANFIRKLNGKRDPYEINSDFSRNDVDNILNQLEEDNLLRHSKVLVKGIGSLYLTLWKPRRTKRLRVVANVFNFMLNVLWLPLLIIGVFLFTQDYPFGGANLLFVGGIVGLLTGSVFHEFGHMFASVANDGHIFEMGVMINHFLPGAYVLISTDGIKSQRRVVNVNSAGIRTNFLLFGIFMILTYVFADISVLFISAAVTNALLGMVNLIFTGNLDGISIISGYLGIKKPEDIISKIISDKEVRKRLLSKGLTGYVIITAGAIFTLFRLVLPMLIAMSVLEVVACFI